MSPRQAFVSAIHLFVVLAFFAAGFIFVALPYLPEIQTQLIEQSTLIGFALLVTSLILLLGFYALDRGRYLVIQMGTATDLNVIRQTVEECFDRQFPKQIFLLDIELGKQLEIRARMADLDEHAIAAAEQALSILLKDRFGYSKPFHFIVKL